MIEILTHKEYQSMGEDKRKKYLTDTLESINFITSWNLSIDPFYNRSSKNFSIQYLTFRNFLFNVIAHEPNSELKDLAKKIERGVILYPTPVCKSIEFPKQKVKVHDTEKIPTGESYQEKTLVSRVV